MKILTIDVEEWFHILDIGSTKNVKHWSGYESRIHRNLELILELLQKHSQKATFFCLGWIAEKYPEVIRDIVNEGYEIGSHSYMHQLVYEQSPDEFRKDLDASVKLLEDVSGAKVRYYRAPGFSIKEENAWAFEILAGYGIEVDCSIFPAPRAHGGFLSYSAPVPSMLSYKGIQLREFPISYVPFAGKPLVFSGGGYFRIFPYSLIKKWTRDSRYVMSYLHPRDFDTGQPRLRGLSAIRTFKSYVGIASAKEKLNRWISDFHFTDLRTAIETIDWNAVPVVCISDVWDDANN